RLGTFHPFPTRRSSDMRRSPWPSRRSSTPPTTTPPPPDRISSVRSLRRPSPSTSTTESPRSTRPPCCQPPPRSSTAARGAPGHEHRRHTAKGPDMSQAPFYVSPEQLMKDRADF